MPVISLRGYQEEALNKMKIGSILHGTTGSGKSRTGIAFFYIDNGGEVNTPKFVPMKNPRDLYIITPAKKRDEKEWEGELANFYMSTNPELNHYKNKIVVDSWNNITKYVDVKNAFFIFDEQKVIGYGVWVQSFLKIASNNRWILLTATPGDTWIDYIPVFIANGFYRNKTDFIRRHVVYSRFTKYPKVEKYIDEGTLLKHRNQILVTMKYEKKTISHYESIIVDYDKEMYDTIVKSKWNSYENKPIETAAEYCYLLRKVVNTSIDKRIKLLDIVSKKKKVIIFYSYTYELEILRDLFQDSYPMAEWNGEKHEQLPTGDHWVYLVQYAAGCEAWNCTTTDTIVFYSQSYSYKSMVQACGRIDRMNTPFIDLYYYYLKTNSKIDNAITRTLKAKKQFSEKGFAPIFKKDTEKKPIVVKPPQIHIGNVKHVPIEEWCDIYNSWEDPNNPNYDP